MPVVRAPSTWRRGARAGSDAVTRAAGRRIAADLRAGLTGPGVAAAAGRLRALLCVTAVGLGGLDGKEKADPARYAEMEVRSLTGVGAAKATVH